MKVALLFSSAVLVAQSAPPFAAPSTLDAINARLSHSAVLSVEASGRVCIQSPGRAFVFNLKDVAIAYNGENRDPRVRVASHRPFERGERDALRQSFTCRHQEAAHEVVKMLRDLQKQAQAADPAMAHLQKPVATGDLDLPFGTVGDALAYINDRMLRTLGARLDDHGILHLAAPEQAYRLDLKKAEFMLEPDSRAPKVCVYGNWALERGGEGHRDWESVARESFATRSRMDARQLVKALYVLKGSFTGLAPKDIARLPQVSGERPKEPKGQDELLAAINSRLTVSRVLGVDADGRVTVNAANALYAFNLKDCRFEAADSRSRVRSWFGGLVRVEHRDRDGVLVAPKGGIHRHRSPERMNTLDDQVFSCDTSFEAREVVDCFLQLQQLLRPRA